MIKRSTGFFKIAFFVFSLFIGLFLILFSLTDIRNYVTTEICIFAFCVSITIIPLILELIVYSFGVLIKCIKVDSKEEVLKYQAMKNSQVPYASINDNGIEKMMFFCEKGKIALLTSHNTKIIWESDRDEIIMKTKTGECTSFFKSIYGTKYENVECVVHTVLKDVSKTETSSETEKVATSQTTISDNTKKDKKKNKKNKNNKNNANESIVMSENDNTITSHPTPSAPPMPAPNSQSYMHPTPTMQASSMQVPPTQQNPNPNGNIFDNIQKFNYALDDSDTLIEETIKI